MTTLSLPIPAPVSTTAGLRSGDREAPCEPLIDRSADETPILENSTARVPTIMIAVDESSASVDAVRTAHRLFGDGAKYFVVNVGPSQSPRSWAYAYPVMAPAAWYPAWNDGGADAVTAGTMHAEQRAAVVADSAALDDAIPLGDVGDPATAIIRAAHDHAVDVVVIASHAPSWFHRLLAGSVERELLRDADFAVLVIR